MLLEDLNGIVKCSMQSKSTGWLGYEVVVNRHKFSQAPSRHARKKCAQPRESDELPRPETLALFGSPKPLLWAQPYPHQPQENVTKHWTNCVHLSVKRQQTHLTKQGFWKMGLLSTLFREATFNLASEKQIWFCYFFSFPFFF